MGDRDEQDIDETAAERSGPSGEPERGRERGDGIGADSRVEDWFGQSVDRDAELADDLVAEHGEAEAERRFEAEATGREEQETRHGEQIDPDQGRSAYTDDPG